MIQNTVQHREDAVSDDLAERSALGFNFTHGFCSSVVAASPPLFGCHNDQPRLF
jgi:hypothetical protein